MRPCRSAESKLLDLHERLYNIYLGSQQNQIGTPIHAAVLIETPVLLEGLFLLKFTQIHLHLMLRSHGDCPSLLTPYEFHSNINKACIV